MKLTLKLIKRVGEQIPFIEWRKWLYQEFEKLENFEIFCRFCLPRAFTKPFAQFHNDIIEEFMTGHDSVVAAPRGHGKLIANSTPILTTKGWKKHGDLKIGDKIFSPSGEQITVIAVSEDEEADYVVHTRDGEKIRCHGNHEWTVHDRNIKRLKYQTIETKKMVGDWSEERSRFQLPLREPLVFEKKVLPLDPYFLGLWLGDGSESKPAITHDLKDSITVKSTPYEINNVCIHKTPNVATSYFSHQGIIQKIKQLNLYKNKHIPEEYFQSSIEQRLELLAGLIDSDGHVCKKRGRVRFININKRLIDDVERLVISLGSRPYITQQEPTESSSGIVGKNICYTVNFDPVVNIPTRLKRKKIKRFPHRQLLGVVKVEYAPNGEKGKCIQVDSCDGLYLVGKQLIPTHNSTLIGQGFVIWNILYKKKKYIVYTSQNHMKSTQFLEPIRTEMKYGENIKLIYGEQELQTERDSENNKDREDVFDINGVRVHALSFEKNIRGLKHGNQRPDLIILDDIEGDDRVLNPELRRKDENKLNMQIIPSLDAERGVIKYVGTILHHDSLLAKKLRTHDGKIYRACEITEKGEIIEDTILFPALFTKEKLLEIKRQIGSTPFQSEYLNNPIDDEASIIKREWVINCFNKDYSFNDEVPSEGIMGVDFAFSDRVSADKSAFVIVTRQEKYVISKCFTKRGMSTTEQFDLIQEYYNQYNLYSTALEENSIRSMSKELKNYDFDFTLYWTGNSDKAATMNPDKYFEGKRMTVSKINMIERLATQFENNNIIIPYKTDEDKRIANQILDECTSFGRSDGKLVEVGVHPDIPIALAYALEKYGSEETVLDW